MGYDVIHPYARVHEILGKLNPILRRVSQLQHVLISRQAQVNDLVARWRFVIAFEDLKPAGFLIPRNRALEVADAYARVKKFRAHASYGSKGWQVGKWDSNAAQQIMDDTHNRT